MCSLESAADECLLRGAVWGCQAARAAVLVEGRSVQQHRRLRVKENASCSESGERHTLTR